jgi:hypothetical protein
VYVPAARPEIVVLVPVPVVVTPPGVLVNVHVPVAGKPFNTTLPVDTEHVGCVIVPTVGAEGALGTALIRIFADEVEIHADALVTVYEYVPAARPVIVVLVPEPVVVVPPGVLVSVHVPEAGKPLNTTLPVGTAHVGCVIVPTVGAAGVAGWVLITIFPVDGEVHPDALVTV